MRGYYLCSDTKWRNSLCKKSVRFFWTYTVPLCLVLFFKARILFIFGSVLFSSLTPTFVSHALRLFWVILSLRFFFLITDWSQGIFLRDRNCWFKQADQHRGSECLEILSLRHSTEISRSYEARLVVFVWLLCASPVCWKHHVLCEVWWKNTLIWVTMHHRRKAQGVSILLRATFSCTESELRMLLYT